MIKELTASQKAGIQPFIREWVELVLEDSGDETIRKATLDIYKKMGEENPVIIVLDSPVSIALAVLLWPQQLHQQLDLQLKQQLDQLLNQPLNQQLDLQLKQQLDQQLNQPLNQQLYLQLYQQLNQPLNQQLYQQLYQQLNQPLNQQLDQQFDQPLNQQLNQQLDQQLYPQLYQQLDQPLNRQLEQQFDQLLYQQLNQQLDQPLNQQLYPQLYQQLDQQFKQQLNQQLERKRKLKQQLKRQLTNWYIPIGWSAWAGFYEFASRIGVKFNEEKRKIFTAFVTNVTVIFPFKNVCFVSRKPITTWKSGRLHNEKEAACKFRDGFSMYFLNGVKVPEWLVKTESGNLTIEQMMEIKNAEVRREFVRKYGVDRLIAKGKVKDKDGTYELIDLGKFLINKGYAPYLVMENPSVKGLYHVEGVEPKCQTVEEALRWRNGSGGMPSVLA